MSEETVPVAAVHRFDEARLLAYLRPRLPDAEGPLSVRQFHGGQSNPTFLLDFGGRRYVLRKKPPGTLLPSAHAIEQEYRIMAALAQTDVPVPAMRVLCEDPAVIGIPFYVMDYVAGRILTRPHLPGVPREQRRLIYTEMARTLARLHGVDHEAVGLGDFGRPGGYIARQIDRWTRQY